MFVLFYSTASFVPLLSVDVCVINDIINHNLDFQMTFYLLPN